jgi:hypothetical protein
VITKSPSGPAKGKQAGNKHGNGGRGGRGGRGEAKPRTAEELDAQMDEYFLKSGDEKLVAAKLNEDLDSYWKNKPAEMEE